MIRGRNFKGLAKISRTAKGLYDLFEESKSLQHQEPVFYELLAIDHQIPTCQGISKVVVEVVEPSVALTEGKCGSLRVPHNSRQGRQPVCIGRAEGGRG